jgi:ABC-type molybdate transport system substrate-binding protein
VTVARYRLYDLGRYPGLAIGLLTRDHLAAAGRWEQLDRRVVVKTDTVTQSANAVKVGSVDAAVVWDTVARQHPDLAAVRLPELDGIVARVQVGVLKQSTDPAGAAAFARFLADPGGGLVHFRAAGFEVGP